jgi:Helicase associated domain
MLEGINFVWDVINAEWDEKYQRLVQWTQAHNSSSVPISDPDLGAFVSKQRQNKKRGKLLQRKIDALDRIGFVWCTSVRGAAPDADVRISPFAMLTTRALVTVPRGQNNDWGIKFRALCAWQRETGHANVPFTGGVLGWWSNTQRQSRRKGTLRMDRVERLDSIGFDWAPAVRRGRVRKGHPSRASGAPHTFAGAAEGHRSGPLENGASCSRREAPPASSPTLSLVSEDIFDDAPQQRQGQRHWAGLVHGLTAPAGLVEGGLGEAARVEETVLGMLQTEDWCQDFAPSTAPAAASLVSGGKRALLAEAGERLQDRHWTGMTHGLPAACGLVEGGAIGAAPPGSAGGCEDPAEVPPGCDSACDASEGGARGQQFALSDSNPAAEPNCSADILLLMGLHAVGR